MSAFTPAEVLVMANDIEGYSMEDNERHRDDVEAMLRAYAALLPATAEAARLLQAWLEADDCDCDGDHICGRQAVVQCVARLEREP